ncbi:MULTISPECIES: hypothetical protein [unclassified Sphingobium]|uniref:hypothetical protein n=1 Tax=unclassified Sphingobium TaxID=2611147 RepID=UPI0022256CAE|nr:MULTISPECIES: hypothetical protein [unclassified Sphingobium]MCW2395200.1 hypothetical protein [Sphingobium sp. B8D3B]MCW2418714.1 hypothetical protein [Sphingobium sp. B8D3C]
MTARAIGGVLAGRVSGERARTFQKVWRDSRHPGDYESRRWARENTFPSSENNARMTQLEHLMLSTKLPGRRRGIVGDVELAVYRFLLRRRCRKTGRLDYAINYISQAVRRSRSAVVTALKNLKAHGFLDWQRRTEPVDDYQPGGQYVRQISNAYFLTLPGKVANIIRRILRRPPAGQAEAIQTRKIREAWDALPPEEQLAQVTDPYLRKTLERMSRLFSNRASPPGGMIEAVSE